MKQRMMIDSITQSILKQMECFLKFLLTGIYEGLLMLAKNPGEQYNTSNLSVRIF